MMIYTIVDYSGIDKKRPLIYRWEIFNGSGELEGIYIGRSKSAKRPIFRYAYNVEKMLLGGETPINKEKFRVIHDKLFEAQTPIGKYKIILTLITNYIEGSHIGSINDLEEDFINKYNSRGDKSWQLNQ